MLAVVNVHGSPVIQFAHFSVKEYLTSARLAKAKDTISRFHISMRIAHTVVAQTCLGVLLHLDKDVSWVDLKYFPLAEYAADHWVDHASFENVSPHVQDGMRRLFDPRKHHFFVWSRIRDPPYLPPTLRSPPFVVPEITRWTPLHYATLFGLHDIAAFLIDEDFQDIDVLDRNGTETSLHVASRKGHAVVAQLLLENGADVMAKSEYERTPLHLASMYGHVEVARVLLKHGAEVDAKDLRTSFSRPRPLYGSLWVSTGSLLDRRFSRGHRQEEGVFRCTPICLALNAGHTDVARVLREHGADSRDHGKPERILFPYSFATTHLGQR